jgi:hypothetical protein
MTLLELDRVCKSHERGLLTRSALHLATRRASA